MQILFLLFCGVALASCCKDNPYFKDAGPLVKTESGSVVGKYVKVFDRDIATFLGIPYAEPPIGEKRFAKPHPVEPWKGMMAASEMPPACTQYSERDFPWIPKTETSENCLYLNIWAPAKCHCRFTGKLPVMVWIHGGGFSYGAISMDAYDGSTLAAFGETIVVSMNYRLGVFGFLDAGTEDAPGNVGLHDQVMALKWVKDNIEYFGGDPNHVTVFGESAGAWSVSLHLVSPLAKGLFNRAIMQSGTMYHPQLADVPQVARYKAEEFAKGVLCVNETVKLSTNPSAVVQCLKQHNARELAEAENTITSKTITLFMPTIGNEYLPKPPMESYDSGEFAKVDVLMGTVKNEGTIFLNYLMPEIFPVDRMPQLNLDVAKQILLGLLKYVSDPVKKEALQFYTKNVKDTDDVAVLVDILANTFGDYGFSCSVMFLAEKLNNSYMYLVSHRSLRNPSADWLGVSHISDVPYVFGKPIMDTEHYTPEDGRYSADLIQKWTNFARTGYPLDISSQFRWPKFTTTEPTLLELNPRGNSFIKFPRKEACEFWRKHFEATAP